MIEPRTTRPIYTRWWFLSLAALAVLAALVIGVVGLFFPSRNAESTGQAPRVTVRTTTVTVTSVAPADVKLQDRVFFALLDNYNSFDANPPDQLAAKGRELCAGVKKGGGGEDMKRGATQMMIDLGIPVFDAAGFTVTSMVAYCPELLVKVR